MDKCDDPTRRGRGATHGFPKGRSPTSDTIHITVRFDWSSICKRVSVSNDFCDFLLRNKCFFVSRVFFINQHKSELHIWFVHPHEFLGIDPIPWSWVRFTSRSGQLIRSARYLTYNVRVGLICNFWNPICGPFFNVFWSIWYKSWCVCAHFLPFA